MAGSADFMINIGARDDGLLAFLSRLKQELGSLSLPVSQLANQSPQQNAALLGQFEALLRQREAAARGRQSLSAGSPELAAIRQVMDRLIQILPAGLTTRQAIGGPARPPGGQIELASPKLTATYRAAEIEALGLLQAIRKQRQVAERNVSDAERFSALARSSFAQAQAIPPTIYRPAPPQALPPAAPQRSISQQARQIEEADLRRGQARLQFSNELARVERQADTAELSLARRRLELARSALNRLSIAPPSEQLSGGSHEIRVYQDQSLSQLYAFKPQREHRALADVAAGQLAAAAGIETAPVSLATIGGRLGSLQGVFGTSATRSRAFPGVPNISVLSEQDIRTLQRNAIVDWLISNHDAHAGQFIRVGAGGQSPGRLIETDLGQAFRFFGKDRLDPLYNPNVTPSVANILHAAVGRGQAPAGFQSLAGGGGAELRAFIEQIMGIVDREIEAAIRPYAEASAKAGELATGGPYANNPQAFIGAVIARKDSLLKDWTNYHERLGRGSSNPTISPAGEDPAETIARARVQQAALAEFTRIRKELIEKGYAAIQASLKALPPGDIALGALPPGAARPPIALGRGTSGPSALGVIPAYSRIEDALHTLDDLVARVLPGVGKALHQEKDQIIAQHADRGLIVYRGEAVLQPGASEYDKGAKPGEFGFFISGNEKVSTDFARHKTNSLGTVVGTVYKMVIEDVEAQLVPYRTSQRRYAVEQGHLRIWDEPSEGLTGEAERRPRPGARFRLLETTTFSSGAYEASRTPAPPDTYLTAILSRQGNQNGLNWGYLDAHRFAVPGTAEQKRLEDIYYNLPQTQGALFKQLNYRPNYYSGPQRGLQEGVIGYLPTREAATLSADDYFTQRGRITRGVHEGITTTDMSVLLRELNHVVEEIPAAIQREEIVGQQRLAFPAVAEQLTGILGSKALDTQTLAQLGPALSALAAFGSKPPPIKPPTAITSGYADNEAFAARVNDLDRLLGSAYITTSDYLYQLVKALKDTGVGAAYTAAELTKMATAFHGQAMSDSKNEIGYASQGIGLAEANKIRASLGLGEYTGLGSYGGVAIKPPTFQVAGGRPLDEEQQINQLDNLFLHQALTTKEYLDTVTKALIHFDDGLFGATQMLEDARAYLDNVKTSLKDIISGGYTHAQVGGEDKLSLSQANQQRYSYGLEALDAFYTTHEMGLTTKELRGTPTPYLPIYVPPPPPLGLGENGSNDPAKRAQLDSRLVSLDIHFKQATITADEYWAEVYAAIDKFGVAMDTGLEMAGKHFQTVKAKIEAQAAKAFVTPELDRQAQSNLAYGNGELSTSPIEPPTDHPYWTPKGYAGLIENLDAQFKAGEISVKTYFVAVEDALATYGLSITTGMVSAKAHFKKLQEEIKAAAASENIPLNEAYVNADPKLQGPPPPPPRYVAPLALGPGSGGGGGGNKPPPNAAYAAGNPDDEQDPTYAQWKAEYDRIKAEILEEAKKRIAAEHRAALVTKQTADLEYEIYLKKQREREQGFDYATGIGKTREGYGPGQRPPGGIGPPNPPGPPPEDPLTTRAETNASVARNAAIVDAKTKEILAGDDAYIKALATVTISTQLISQKQAELLQANTVYIESLAKEAANRQILAANLAAQLAGEAGTAEDRALQDQRRQALVDEIRNKQIDATKVAELISLDTRLAEQKAAEVNFNQIADNLKKQALLNLPGATENRATGKLLERAGVAAEQIAVNPTVPIPTDAADAAALRAARGNEIGVLSALTIAQEGEAAAIAQRIRSLRSLVEIEKTDIAVEAQLQIAKRTQSEKIRAAVAEQVRANPAAAKELAQIQAQRVLDEREYAKLLKATVKQEARNRGLGGFFGLGNTRTNDYGPSAGIPTSFGSFFGQGLKSTVQYGLPATLAYSTLGILREGFKSAADLERQFALIKSQFDSAFGDESASKLKDFRAEIFGIARETGIAAEEIAQVGLQIAGAFNEQTLGALNITDKTGGFTQQLQGSNLISKQLEDAAKLATVTQLSAGEITNTLTAASLGFKRSFGDIGDITLQLQNTFGVLAKETIDFLGDVAPVMSQMGFTLEQAAAIGAKVQQLSGRSGQALAEQLNRILPQIGNAKVELLGIAEANKSLLGADADPNKGAPSFIKDIATSNIPAVFFDLAKVFDQLDPSAQAFLDKIIGSRRETQTLLAAFKGGGLDKTVADLATSGGTLNDKFREVSKTWQVEVAKMRETFKQLAVAITGAGVLDALKAVVEVLKDVAAALTPVAVTIGKLLNIMDGAPIKFLAWAAAITLAAKAVVALTTAMRGLELQKLLGSLEGAFALRGTPGVVGGPVGGTLGSLLGFGGVRTGGIAAGTKAAGAGTAVGGSFLTAEELAGLGGGAGAAGAGVAGVAVWPIALAAAASYGVYKFIKYKRDQDTKKYLQEYDKQLKALAPTLAAATDLTESFAKQQANASLERQFNAALAKASLPPAAAKVPVGGITNRYQTVPKAATPSSEQQTSPLTADLLTNEDIANLRADAAKKGGDAAYKAIITDYTTARLKAQFAGISDAIDKNATGVLQDIQRNGSPELKLALAQAAGVKKTVIKTPAVGTPGTKNFTPAKSGQTLVTSANDPEVKKYIDSLTESDISKILTDATTGTGKTEATALNWLTALQNYGSKLTFALTTASAKAAATASQTYDDVSAAYKAGDVDISAARAQFNESIAGDLKAIADIDKANADLKNGASGTGPGGTTPGAPSLTDAIAANTAGKKQFFDDIVKKEKDAVTNEKQARDLLESELNLGIIGWADFAEQYKESLAEQQKVIDLLQSQGLNATQQIIDLATATQNFHKLYATYRDNWATEAGDLRNLHGAAGDDSTIPGIQASIDDAVAELADPQYTDKNARLATAKRVVALLKKQRQALADQATTAAEKARILNEEVKIPDNLASVLAEGEIRDNPDIAAFFDAYTKVLGTSLSDAGKTIFAAFLMKKGGLEALSATLEAEKQRLLALVAISGFDSSIISAIEQITAAEGLLETAAKTAISVDTYSVGSGSSSGSSAADTAKKLADAYANLERAKVENDPIALAELNQRLAQEAIDNAADDADRINAEADKIRADHSLAEAYRALGLGRYNLLIAQANAADNDVEAARLAKEQAYEALAIAQYKYANHEGGALDVQNAQIEAINRDKAYKDAVINDKRDQASFLYDIGKITKTQYINLLEGILSTTEVGSKLFRDLTKQIYDLKKSTSGDLQFNLPTVFKLPTLYQARRITQAGGIDQAFSASASGGSINDNRIITITLNVTNGMTQQQAVDLVTNAVGSNRSGFTPRIY